MCRHDSTTYDYDGIITLDEHESERLLKIIEKGPRRISATTWPINVRAAMRAQKEALAKGTSADPADE